MRKATTRKSWVAFGLCGALALGLRGLAGCGSAQHGASATHDGGSGSSSGSSNPPPESDGAPNGTGISLSPSTAQTSIGGSVQFTATVTGASSTSVAWSVQEGASGGAITSQGLYTAPANAGTYHVVATSTADSALTATAAVTVNSVAACSALGDAGTGAWQSITPPGVTWTDAIIVDPFDPGTVWLGTNGTGLYKSTDCAATWTHVNTGSNGSQIDTGEMSSMQVDPVNQGTIYTVEWNGAEGLWKSTNAGVDWTQLFPPGSEVANVVFANEVSSVGMEAANTSHLVVAMHANCSSPYGIICEAESTNGGSTWTITTVPASCPGSSYCPGAGAFILNASTWLFGTYTDGLWLTTDHGNTWNNVVPSGGEGATGGKTLNQPFVPSPNGMYYLASEEGILTSSNGTTWSLITNSGGSAVGFAMGDGNLYAADQWTVSYHTASESNPTTWSTMTAPPAQPYQGYPQGGVYLDYDSAHHILYSSNWAGGAWRMVTQ
jgi:hypothetical protein